MSFPKPPKRKDERATRKRIGRAAYLNARAQYLLELARDQGRLNVTDLAFERMMLTPRSFVQNLKPSEYPLCEMRLPQTGCDEKQRHARDIHHKRGRVGDDYVDQTKFVGCCRACHNYIEQNRDFAIQEGWSESRIQQEEENV